MPYKGRAAGHHHLRNSSYRRKFTFNLTKSGEGTRDVDVFISAPGASVRGRTSSCALLYFEVDMQWQLHPPSAPHDNKV